MSENSSNSSGEGGNTISPSPSSGKQPSACKRWCFTLNNYTDEEVDNLISIFRSNSSYIFSKEIGDCGTPHLQGYVEFLAKQRLTAIKKFNNRIHWERCKGNRETNVNYILKDYSEVYQGGPVTFMPEVIYCEPVCDKLKFLVESAKDYPFPKGDRLIHVVVDKVGGLGKTEFARWMVMNMTDCIVLGGKASDMKNAVLEYKNKNGRLPKYIIIDIPRKCNDYVSYTGIEEIKNMLFYSGKYEGGMVNGNKPWMCMLMNQMPDVSALSADRWKIYDDF